VQGAGWNSEELGLTGPRAAELLDKGEPRIALAAGAGGRTQEALPGDTGIAVVSAMMSPGDEKIVAGRIQQVLSAKHALPPAAEPAAPAADLSGRWTIEIAYAASTSSHRLHLRQDGNRLEGLHQGDFLTRDISGTISGDAVTLASLVTERHGDALTYRFSGTVSSDGMSGGLDLGEYLSATWVGRRQ
jgi:hypothetical protein